MPLPPGLLPAVQDRYPRFLAELEAMVNTDCGSYSPDGVNRIADAVADSLGELGATVERVPHPDGTLGDLVIGRLAGEGPRLLLIGHMDTVFDDGTAAARPFRVDADRALGPGTSDMKGGLLAGLHAVAALQALAMRPRLTFVANPDEEIGSPFSTPHIRTLAPEHDAALVLECARANGDIVSSRKGVADLHLRFHGRAAHAGVEPEKGRSAVLAASRAVVALHDLNGRWPGVTVNAGVIEGGTRPNVVAADCLVKLDVRGVHADEFGAAQAAVAQVVAEPAVDGVTTETERIAFHPPMEPSSANVRLAELAVAIAGELRFELRHTATGGASDANTTSAAGLPTLDGLGPIGGDDHSADEWLDLSSVVPRTTLLAALMTRIGEAL